MSTAIAYLRISEDPNDLRLGVERQRADVREVADRIGADLAAVYEDNDVSASKVRKADTAWAKVLQHLVTNPPDYLLCYTLDRLGRRMADHENLEELCAATGTVVLDARGREVFERDSDSWVYESAAAKIEARKTSRRVRRAQADRVKAGKQPNGGRRPYGYEADRLTRIESEVAVLQAAADRIIHGDSVSSVVRWLNDSGARTVTGKTWSVQVLKQMLRNPRYVGDLAKFNRKALEYDVIGKAAWADHPVFDRETWEALQAALRKRLNKGSGRPPVPTLLGGLLYCGQCLRPMYRSRNGYKGSPDTYRCDRSKGGCGQNHRRMQVLDDYVCQYVIDHADPFALREERARLEAKLKHLRHEEWLAIGEMDAVKWAYRENPREVWLLPEVNRRTDEREAARRHVEEARLALERATRADESGTRWQEGSLEERRRWVRANVAGVVCDPVPARSAFDPESVRVTLASEAPPTV